jgi:hypothetical protein
MGRRGNVDALRHQQQVVELRRKAKKAAARRAGLQYLAYKENERRLFSALRTSAKNI